MYYRKHLLFVIIRTSLIIAVMLNVYAHIQNLSVLASWKGSNSTRTCYLAIIIIMIMYTLYSYNSYSICYEYNDQRIYIIIPKCACVCVFLCTFYLKTVSGNDLILFASWRDSSRLGFKILTKICDVMLIYSFGYPLCELSQRTI